MKEERLVSGKFPLYKMIKPFRTDTNFLDKLLHLLQNPILEVMKNRDKKLTLQCGLKVLCLIMLKTKIEDESKFDIVKNNKIPSSLITNLK